MNKYEKDFNILDNLPVNDMEDCSTLGIVQRYRELVERATAKKVLNIDKIGNRGFLIGNCPICGNPVTNESKFCNKDGFALDWSNK